VENYRGIALLNDSFKIFSTMINNRVSEWLERGKKIGESQAGFRRGRGCEDHIWTLNAIVDWKVNGQKKKCYAMFVDMKMAFDSLNREILFESVYKMGIKGKCFRMIKELYRDTRSSVRLEDGKRKSWESREGVRQGDPLSPTLFNIFLNDLEVKWERNLCGGCDVAGLKIRCLKYADDVVVLAESGEALSAMISRLSEYFRDKRLTMNLCKTKIMIFRKGGNIKKSDRWFWRGKEIEVVEEYTYLGFKFSSRGSHKKHTEMVRSRAQTAINSLWGVQEREGWNFKTGLHVFDMAVRPSLLYGAVIWGLWEVEAIEIIHRRFLKWSLGMPSCTASHMLMLETGRLEILIVNLRTVGRFIAKILRMNTDRWPYIIWRWLVDGWSRQKVYGWGAKLLEWFDRTGCSEIVQILRDGDPERFEEGWNSMLFKLIGQRIQGWWCGIENSVSCPYYKEIKKTLGTEAYLLKNTHTWIRKTWARLRMGALEKVEKPWLKEKSVGCYLCDKWERTMSHIWICEGMQDKKELKMEIDKERKRGGSEWWVRKLNREEPNLGMCKWVREYEKRIVKKKKVNWEG
jgi:hypothetical protein